MELDFDCWWLGEAKLVVLKRMPHDRGLSTMSFFFTFDRELIAGFMSCVLYL